MKIGCVVMAAGLSSRFGGNKLLFALEGKRLIDRALDAVPGESLYRVVVVAHAPEVLAAAADRGFECVRNECPAEGVSLTIRLGLERLREADAALFMVCDQPLLTRASVAAETELYRRNPDRIVRMACGGTHGNPCIFPAAFFPELRALRGDTGGSEVIRRHAALLLPFELADPSELRDVDYSSALAELRGGARWTD